MVTDLDAVLSNVLDACEENTQAIRRLVRVVEAQNREIESLKKRVRDQSE